MTQRLIAIQATTWHIAVSGKAVEVADLNIPFDASFEEVAAGISQNLAARGISDRELLIALDGSMFMAATIEHNGGRARQRNPMTFLFEEQLPLSAEDIVCDFVVRKRQALGVAAKLAELRELIEIFANFGLIIQSITPITMLVLQNMTQMLENLDGSLVLLNDDRNTHLIVIKSGKPILWRILRNSTEEIVREYHLIRHSFPDLNRGIAVNVSSEASQKLSATDANVLDSIEQDLIASCAETASRVINGQEDPWVELLRPPLEVAGGRARINQRSKRLVKLCVSALFLLFCFAAGFWIRADKYDSLADSLQQEQETIFAELFPGQRIPSGVRSRLASEQRKLAGLTGHVDDVPSLNSALVTIYRILSPLPKDLRFRILEIHIDGESIYLEGEARQHGDADLIAASLRSVGFDVSPPRTERLAEKGVGYVVEAHLVKQNTASTGDRS